MDLALVERLICPGAHEPAPLVVRADEVAHGTMIRGIVGCPVCFAEWSVRDGILMFGDLSAHEAVASPDAATAAALLALHEPGRIVLVDGAPSALLNALGDEFGAVVVAFDAPANTRAAGVLHGAATVPIAAGVARGALLLRPSRPPEFVASVVRALGGGARIVAAAAIEVPRDVRELARDDGMWVGEREIVTAPVPLRRA